MFNFNFFNKKPISLINNPDTEISRLKEKIKTLEKNKYVIDFGIEEITSEDLQTLGQSKQVVNIIRKIINNRYCELIDSLRECKESDLRYKQDLSNEIKSLGMDILNLQERGEDLLIDGNL